jgi:nitrite reductase/ring-hydroxylating ferredoxin subunit
LSDFYEKFSRAPDVGTVICQSEQVALGSTVSFDLNGVPVLISRTVQGLFAYVNACPHQYLPLDYRKGNVLTSDGAQILCSNHDARFEVETGNGVSGFGEGCALDAVPIVEANGEISLA